MNGLTRQPNGKITYAVTNHITMLRVPQEPKARTDKPGKAIDRIKAAIDKTMPENRSMPSGRPCGGGYEILTTDGHRALLVPGEGNGEPIALNLCDTEDYRVSVIDSPEFHLAIKRALVATNDRNRTVRLTCIDGVLTVESSLEEGLAFDETLRVTSTKDWRVALNGLFLEQVCGSWPLHVWTLNQEKQVTFEPADRSWRYVVMPVRYWDEEMPVVEKVPWWMVATTEAPSAPWWMTETETTGATV